MTHKNNSLAFSYRKSVVTSYTRSNQGLIALIYTVVLGAGFAVASFFVYAVFKLWS